MISIVDKITQYTTSFLTDHYPTKTKRLFGFCELISEGGQPMPVTINGTGERQQVSLDDEYDVITWVRLPGQITPIRSEEDTWGLKEGRRMRAGLRWVVAHKVELGENFILSLLQELPGTFQVNGYQFVHVDEDINVNADHENVYQTELGPTVYEKHRLNWNIYAVELNVEFIVCDSLTSP